MTTASNFLSNNEVIALAQKIHTNQLDKAGNDYFTSHIEDVVSRLPKNAKNYLIQAAYLHDSIEDTEATKESLAKEGISPEVIALVVELTHLPGEVRDDYIKRLSYRALLVKYVDNNSNGDPKRLNKIIDQETRTRLKAKYQREKLLIENRIAEFEMNDREGIYS